MIFRPLPFIRFFARWFIYIYRERYVFHRYLVFNRSPLRRTLLRDMDDGDILLFVCPLCVSAFATPNMGEVLCNDLHFQQSDYLALPVPQTKCLAVERCHIGVEKEISHWKIEYYYIYFSLKPYPREFASRIDKLPNSEAFLKYRFEPKLAEHILDTLPKGQTKQLEYYYYVYLRNRKKNRKRPRK